MEGRYAARNDTNNLYDSLIDAPDSIDHPDIRWYPLDRCRCLHRIKCNVGGGAKIERSGGTVPQLTKTGMSVYLSVFSLPYHSLELAAGFPAVEWRMSIDGWQIAGDLPDVDGKT